MFGGVDGGIGGSVAAGGSSSSRQAGSKLHGGLRLVSRADVLGGTGDAGLGGARPDRAHELGPLAVVHQCQGLLGG